MSHRLLGSGWIEQIWLDRIALTHPEMPRIGEEVGRTPSGTRAVYKVVVEDTCWIYCWCFWSALDASRHRRCIISWSHFSLGSMKKDFLLGAGRDLPSDFIGVDTVLY
jgi:hypothetical protein